jgi:hypothetical protein
MEMDSMNFNRLICIQISSIACAVGISAAGDPCEITPEFIGEYRTPATANQVQVVDDVAYVVDWFPSRSLQILDVSDPSDPLFLGSLSLSTYPVGFAVEGANVYLPGSSSGLRIIDASDPTAPVQVGFYGGIGPTRDVVVEGSTAFIAMTNAMRVVDVSDPAAPSMIGESSIIQASIEFVAVNGEMVYTTDYFDGILQVFDVSDPSTPTVVGTLPGLSFVYDIAAVGSMVYVTDFLGLHIIDASDPAAPLFKSFTNIGHANGVTVIGTTAYIAGGDGLVVFDVSDPSAPYLLGSSHTPQPSRGIAVVGDIAFVADDSFGLQIFDVTNDCSQCPADITADGVLDIFDVLAFVEAYNALEPAADYTGDGNFDIFDVLEFVSAYNAGCP